jgi:hypothetical protein
VSPSTQTADQPRSALPRPQELMALLSSLHPYRHLFAGLTNATLRELVAAHIPGYNARQMTYDLRRPVLVHTALLVAVIAH